MKLETWLESRDDRLSRDLLAQLRRDEGRAIEGDDPNLLGLDIETHCGQEIVADIERSAGWTANPTRELERLYKRAKLVLYG